MAVVESRPAPSAPAVATPPVPPRLHVRGRVTSRSERSAVAIHSVMMLALLGLFLFVMSLDLESPYAEGLALFWGVVALHRVAAWWKFGFVYSDAGLMIYSAVMRHWLPWRSVTAISESEIRRQNAISLLLSGAKPVRVLRVHRRYRWPIRVRATRGISDADLDALRTIAVRNGTTWWVGEDFSDRARERGVWALGHSRA